ncbi:DoxX family protein [Protofrankia coriariae]|uniref:DoxX family protein n=1 Tax=Protofrankia coriariae TaxID=1562887 RepID=A0ABR5F6U6_9ACTN|nr:DoxX family protein [Protofrankia coriariae]KLL12449.1 DoxX family protein [Protofrankia coriariae]
MTSLILRAAVGTTMIAHGVKHGRTIQGTADWFQMIGFREPELQARLSAVVEVGAGGALLVGAGTPLAASAVVGTMGVAARSVHVRNGFFITAEGYEYVLNLAAAAVALSTLGPGRFSVDRLFKHADDHPSVRRGLLTAGIGLGAAAVQLAAFWRRPA